MKMQRHGGDIYRNPGLTDFSVNINPLGPPEAVRRAVVESAQRVEQYPDVKKEALTKEIAAFEDVPEDFIVCGNGAADVIYAFCAALRPKKALLPVPAFSEYASALSAAGARIIRHGMGEEDGFALTQSVLEKITWDTGLIVLCSPNNPTGACIAPQLLDKILKRCAQTGTFVLLDACFNGFLSEASRYSAAMQLEAYPNLFIVKAFTKLFAMPALRLGYGLCADSGVISAVEAQMQDWNVSGPAQAAGIAALRDPHLADYLEEMRGLLKKERAGLVGALRQRGFKVYTPQANYIFFKADTAFAARAKAAGFLIRDCANYDGLAPGYCRISVNRPEDNARFKAFLAADA